MKLIIEAKKISIRNKYASEKKEKEKEEEEEKIQRKITDKDKLQIIKNDLEGESEAKKYLDIKAEKENLKLHSQNIKDIKDDQKEEKHHYKSKVSLSPSFPQKLHIYHILIY